MCFWAGRMTQVLEYLPNPEFNPQYCQKTTTTNRQMNEHKTKIVELPYYPTISLLGIYPNEMQYANTCY
jgi:hypothetical protein